MKWLSLLVALCCASILCYADPDVTVRIVPEHLESYDGYVEFDVYVHKPTDQNIAVSFATGSSTLKYADIFVSPGVLNTYDGDAVVKLTVEHHAGMRIQGTHEIVLMTVWYDVVSGASGALYDTCRLTVTPHPTWEFYSMKTSAMLDDGVDRIAVAADGTALIGTEDGIAKFDGTSWTSYTHKQLGIDASEIRRYGGEVALCASASQGMLIGAGDSLLRLQNDGTTSIRVPRSGFYERMIVDVDEAPDSSIWVMRMGNFLAHWHGDTWTAYDHGSDKTVPAWDEELGVEVGPDGTVWMATGTTIVRFDGTYWDQFDLADIFPVNEINDLCVDPKGVVWIACDVGVVRIAGSGGRFYPNTDGTSFPGEYANVVASDSSGGIWTRNQETVSDWVLNRYDGNSFTIYDFRNSLVPETGISTMVAGPANSMWIGASNGLLIYRGDHATSVHENDVATESPFSIVGITPNPASEIAQMHICASIPSWATIAVYDQAGRHLATVYDGELAAGSHAIDVPVRDLPQGACFLCVRAAGGVVTQPITVVR